MGSQFVGTRYTQFHAAGRVHGLAEDGVPARIARQPGRPQAECAELDDVHAVALAAVVAKPIGDRSVTTWLFKSSRAITASHRAMSVPPRGAVVLSAIDARPRGARNNPRRGAEDSAGHDA